MYSKPISSTLFVHLAAEEVVVCTSSKLQDEEGGRADARPRLPLDHHAPRRRYFVVTDAAATADHGAESPNAASTIARTPARPRSGTSAVNSISGARQRCSAIPTD